MDSSEVHAAIKEAVEDLREELRAEIRQSMRENLNIQVDLENEYYSEDKSLKVKLYLREGDTEYLISESSVTLYASGSS